MTNCAECGKEIYQKLPKWVIENSKKGISSGLTIPQGIIYDKKITLCPSCHGNWDIRDKWSMM